MIFEIQNLRDKCIYGIPEGKMLWVRKILEKEWVTDSNKLLKLQVLYKSNVFIDEKLNISQLLRDSSKSYANKLDGYILDENFISVDDLIKSYDIR